MARRVTWRREYEGSETGCSASARWMVTGFSEWK
jgi:hypothetical protein